MRIWQFLWLFKSVKTFPNNMEDCGIGNGIGTATTSVTNTNKYLPITLDTHMKHSNNSSSSNLTSWRPNITHNYIILYYINGKIYNTRLPFNRWQTTRKCVHLVVLVHPNFYPNVTMLRSGLCYRKSVCRLSVCLSVVCLSVTLVHPTQGAEAFGNVSSPLCTLAILWPPCKILRR